MNQTQSLEVVPTRTITVEADSKRKAELRKSIEASTARLVTIATSRDPDSDPEAA